MVRSSTAATLLFLLLQLAISNSLAARHLQAAEQRPNSRQLQQTKGKASGLSCASYVVMTTNIPALGATEQLGDGVSASINCATRPTPLATLGGRCSVVCDEPSDLRRVMITDQNIMAAPANYLKTSLPKEVAAEFVDPVFCQLTVTDAPLKGECQLRAQAVCCQA